ncbi:MAG: dioxygenase [Burkholderiales bacterium]|nr:dioxygenase [Burkholderiales bacterium]
MNNFKNVLFVPHGSPTFALNPGAAGAAMSAITQKLPPARAIVVVSPHWDTPIPTVSMATQLETIHDFYGFPEELYQLQYPATGCPEVAQEVVLALQSAGFEVAQDNAHGLDHGAWQPLRQMFPDADVPIVPLSMQMHGGPAHAYRIGQALSTLTDKNIWVIASGNITHNLRDWHMVASTNKQTPGYVQGFADWVEEKLKAHDAQALIHYRQHSAQGRQAHPSEDHLLPLFVALGAAGDNAQAQAFFRGVSDYVIAMDGYAFLH